MTSALEKLWAETFRHAAEHSPFYREMFRGVSACPPLAEVPTVDKKIVSERNLDFLCVPRERVVEVVTTSGTTGQPLLWMLTDIDLPEKNGLVVTETIRKAESALASGDAADMIRAYHDMKGHEE